MLYNVVIDRKPKAYDWTVNESYLMNEDMHQRIRINDGILDGFTINKVDEDKVGDATVTSYSIPSCRYVCNNKTLNPILMSTNRADDESDNVIVFVAVNTYFRIAEYDLHTENRKNIKILRTFKLSKDKKITHFGCTIVSSKKDLMEKNNGVITLTLVSGKDNENVVRYHFALEGDSLNVVCENLTGTPEADKFKNVVSNRKRYGGFNFHTLPNQMLTCTILCPKSREKEAEEVSKHLKKRFIVAIPDESITDSAVIKSELEKIDITTNHIRAVTVLGMAIPKEVASELRLMYVFKYNETTKALDLVR